MKIGPDWRRTVLYGCVLCPQVEGGEHAGCVGFEAPDLASYEEHARTAHSLTKEDIKAAKGEFKFHISSSKRDERQTRYKLADGREFLVVATIWTAPKRTSKTREKKR